MDELKSKIAVLSPARRALLERRLQQHSRGGGAGPTIGPRTERTSAQASFAQQRLWFLNQLEPDQALYNVPRALRLEGPLDIDALRATLMALVQRHETLRTHFSVVDGSLRQIISDGFEIPLVEVDLSDLPHSDQEARIFQLAKEEAARPFDLKRGPVIRTTLLRLSKHDHVLLLTTHHIVSDAWSTTIFFREFGELYDDAVLGSRPPALAPLAIQYADFAEWQRNWLQGETLAEQVKYWKDQLAGVTGDLALPTDRVRPPVPTFRGAYKTLKVSSKLSNQLTELSKHEGVTLFMTLLAAFQTLLYRYTGQEEIVVGSPIAGRNHAETENLIGFFVNTLVLRSNLSGDPTFREVLSRVRATAVGAYDHQDLPFEKLVEELGPERNLGRNPLFQVMFQYQESSQPSFTSQQLKLSWLDTATYTAKFDLTTAVIKRDAGLECVIEYSTDLSNGETIERMLEHYVTLLGSIVTQPDQRIATLQVMTEKERNEVMAAASGEAVEFPKDSCIHQLFSSQAAQTPDDIAVLFGSDQLSFGELNRRANQLANYLHSHGVGPECRVAIRVERSPRMIVGLLGILKAGGAYVPIDPAYPEERAKFILADSGAHLLLTEDSLINSLGSINIPVVSLDSDWEIILQQSEVERLNESNSENSAHVIYTSGSTGTPKGVISAHRASINRFSWMWRAYPFAVGEVCCQKTSLGFVDSIWEIFGPLLRGVPLVIIDDEAVKDPARFVQCLARHKVSRVVLVPSLLRVILESDEPLAEQLPHLRYCVCSGETLSATLARKFREKLPHTVLINLYGSSEVAADVTCYEVNQVHELASVPIGKPIANTRTLILDQAMQPVPFLVVGEIHVGGEGLAQGYLNRAELTAERFAPDPFIDGDARLFRTGDLGRMLVDGNIEYHGRRDLQVKVRGFRIELEEIETVLKTYPGLGQVVVLARDDERGEPQLVAYLTGSRETFSTEELRTFLKRRLPDYMIPAAFVTLDSYPLTPSGKIDRMALRAPDLNPRAIRVYVAPRTPVEEVLASIWAETISCDRVGINDDFFELGGHSLLVARIVSRVREELHVELPMRTLFEGPTVSELALEVERLRQKGTGLGDLPLAPIPADERHVLSFAQERLWFFDQLEPGSAAYNIPRALRMKGPFDRQALERSLAVITQRHEILRTCFSNDAGKPALTIDDNAAVDVRFLDLREVPHDERAARSCALAANEASQPFDLNRAPLLRACLAEFADDDHLLVLVFHHIVCDGWSVGVFMRELVSLYNLGGENSLPALPLQYGDFAAWQRRSLDHSSLEKQLGYWREQLVGAPELINLPIDRVRPSVRSFLGAKHPVNISSDVSKGLLSLARSERATPFMAFLAAFQLLLACITGDQDIVVGAPTAGRNKPEVGGLIGYFVNTMVLRAQLNDNPDFRELLRQVRERALGAFANQEVPFEKLVEELHPERSLSHNALFQVWFVLQNVQSERDDFRDLTTEPVAVENASTRHDLQLSLWETDDGLEGAFTYSTDLFMPETISRIERQFQALLSLVVSQPHLRFSDIRAHLDRVGEGHRTELSEKMEAANRQKLRSIKRKTVGLQSQMPEESWTNPTQ